MSNDTNVGAIIHAGYGSTDKNEIQFLAEDEDAFQYEEYERAFEERYRKWSDEQYQKDLLESDRELFGLPSSRRMRPKRAD